MRQGKEPATKKKGTKKGPKTKKPRAGPSKTEQVKRSGSAPTRLHGLGPRTPPKYTKVELDRRDLDDLKKRNPQCVHIINLLEVLLRQRNILESDIMSIRGQLNTLRGGMPPPPPPIGGKIARHIPFRTLLDPTLMQGSTRRPIQGPSRLAGMGVPTSRAGGTFDPGQVLSTQLRQAPGPTGRQLTGMAQRRRSTSPKQTRKKK